MDDTLNLDNKIFFKRQQQETNNDPDCHFFISLDKIEMVNPQKDMNQFIMLCDVRAHKAASKLIPQDVTGYWVRFFGPQNTFKFYISLWQVLEKKRNNNNDHLMKVNEICIEVTNEGMSSQLATGPESKMKQKRDQPGQVFFPKKNFRGNDLTPSFCSSKEFREIVTAFHDLLEGGKTDDFIKLYESQREELAKKDPNNISVIEYKLFLSIEKSLLQSVQGEYRAAKKTLQQVVSTVSKSPNRTFLLNRAYSYLANIHILEGNLGTVEDCLYVLHADRKGIPFYDLGYFYAIQGELLIHFSQKSPDLKEGLLEESLYWLSKAEAAYKSDAEISSHRLVRLELLKAQIYMFSKSFEMQIMKGLLSHVDTEKLSLRNKCHLFILKSKCSLIEQNHTEAGESLGTCKSISDDCFPQFKTAIKSLEKQLKELEKSNTEMCSRLANLDILKDYGAIEDFGYDGDQSS